MTTLKANLQKPTNVFLVIAVYIIIKYRFIKSNQIEIQLILKLLKTNIE